MLTNHNLRRTIAVFAAVLLACTPYAQARSSNPNPQALAKAASKSARISAQINDEVSTFLGRLAKADEYTKKFDQAVSLKDVDRVLGLIKEGGIKKSRVTIESGAQPNVRLRIRACLDGICVIITITW
jgi:hypothetical protein